MLLSTKGVAGTKLEGKDATLGQVHDLLFDDESWLVRYLVIDTGTWLPGRRVILRPQDVDRRDWTRRTLHSRRTKREIEQSPPLSEHEPVSRQHEARMSAHFLWSHPGPVGPASVSGVGGAPATRAEAATAVVDEADGDPHLRSVDEVRGYRIHATDGEIGHVEDLVVDDSSDEWRIRYLVVDTRNWLPGRKVLVATGWADDVSWDSREVRIDLERQVVKDSPEFDPSQPVNRRYEEQLYDYYGRPAYW